jgi:hypothetical protein
MDTIVNCVHNKLSANLLLQKLRHLQKNISYTKSYLNAKINYV